MSIIGQVVGVPGMRSAKTATHRIIFRQNNWESALAGGRTIDASESRDPGNTGDIDVLRPGLLMGKITASGLYAPALLGVISGAYSSGGTELTVSAAVATEIDRILGQAGTAEMVCIGPPTSAGTVAVTNVTHSAVNTTTGVITVSSLGVDKIAGSFLAVNDGRYTPITIIPDGHGIKVTDGDGTSVDVPFDEMNGFPIAGVITSANVLPAWPSDTSLRAWINTQLNTYGKFVMDFGY